MCQNDILTTYFSISNWSATEIVDKSCERQDSFSKIFHLGLSKEDEDEGDFEKVISTISRAGKIKLS